MRHHRTLLLALIAFLPLPTGALHAQTRETGEEWAEKCRRQRNNRDRERVCEVRSETFRASGGVIHVNASPNGGIGIESSVGNDIEVEARIQAEARDVSRAGAIARAIDVTHSGNTLAARGPNTADKESWSVTYFVRVPRNSDLELRTVNGPLSVRNVRGNISARTTNGPLALTDVAGNVNAESSNGPLSVRLSGSRWEGAGLVAETSNGPVSLSLPEDYNARFEAGTTNGPVDSDLPMTRDASGRRSTHIKATLGSGGSPVSIKTTNGPITIKRR